MSEEIKNSVDTNADLEMLEAIPEDVHMTAESLEESARENLTLLAGIAAPDEIKFAFPKFYQVLWILITSSLYKLRNFDKFAIALPRGHGKTFVVKLWVLFLVLYTKRRFVAVFGAKQEHAINIIRDVCSMLGSNNVRRIYGDWDAEIEKDSAELKIFHFRGRQLILKAEGASTASRGVNIGNARPDVMIFDDAQTKDSSKSTELALKFINWFQATLKAKDPTKCTYVYVGNMYPNYVVREDPVTGNKLYGCHLRNLKDDPNWKSLIIGGILADGTALWEDLQPLEQLLSEYQSDARIGMAEIFLAEVMNDPDAQINTDFDFRAVPENPYEMDGEDIITPDGKFLVIDPSLGKKTASDVQAVGEFWIFGDSVVYRRLLPKELTQVSAPELVRNLITYAMQNKIPLILSEDYSYQATLLQWFDFVSAQLKITGIEFHGINRGHKTKNSAIVDWFKRLTVSPEKETPELMYLHSSMRSILFSRIRSWDKTTEKNKDDELDIGYYASTIRSKQELWNKCFAIEGSVSHGELIVGSGEYR